jgi:hypothetical protein
MAVLLVALMALPANAQQPPSDPRLETYKQLLSEANDRVVGLAAQVQHLQAEIAKLKAPAKEPDKAPVP